MRGESIRWQFTDDGPLNAFMIKVIGVDISPILRPDDMPDNLWLQVSLFLSKSLLLKKKKVIKSLHTPCATLS